MSTGRYDMHIASYGASLEPICPVSDVTRAWFLNWAFHLKKRLESNEKHDQLYLRPKFCHISSTII